VARSGQNGSPTGGRVPPRSATVLICYLFGGVFSRRHAAQEASYGMKDFKKILVGVDLSQGDRLVASELAAPTAEAVRCAICSAAANDAELLFMAVLDVSPHTRHLIEEEWPPERCVLDEARDVLDGLVKQAAASDVRADSLVVFGKPPVEMIRRVITGAHDLVVVGTRELGGTRRSLLGYTAVKLIRKCPCPVWVTKPQDGEPIQSILVADDLSDVGRVALDYGASMAARRDAQLHVLHAVDPPEEHRYFHGHVAEEEMNKRCEEARQAIQTRLEGVSLTKPPEVRVVHQPAVLAILEHIERYRIELLVMGTLARTGVAGILLGNTAERLLPEIRCSVLTVKPADFHSPIRP